MSRFCTSYLDSYTKASTLAGRDFAFTHPILDSPIFTKYILLITKRIGNFTLKNRRRILENCGRIPENYGRILENCGRIPENCGRILENCGRIPEFCDRILENCDRILEFCGRIPEYCGSFPGNCQGFRVKYEDIFRLNSGKPIIFERVQTLLNIIPYIYNIKVINHLQKT